MVMNFELMVDFPQREWIESLIKVRKEEIGNIITGHSTILKSSSTVSAVKVSRSSVAPE
tara:strand:- start:5 stop:181 length:177 start_codon:yes stop_codon:yes gene_type:complete